MGFEPKIYSADADPIIQDRSGETGTWRPLYWQKCSFTPEIFHQVMINLIKNPNINSNHLFRGDILLDTNFIAEDPHQFDETKPSPRILLMDGFMLNKVMIRRLIPRNILVDDPMDQTCLLYSTSKGSDINSLVIYLPHISSPSESPFYHPAVRGIAFLHNFNSDTKEVTVSIHYSFFDSGPQTPFLDRTAQHLLAVLHKHGEGLASGYVKRVQHDTVLPQARVQNTYARLKAKYAKILCTKWVEVTDPTKHVFEDLGIAAFLIELWADMYHDEAQFPGFVDIGCGNGLLVHILIEEGYSGWGFDARRRKSWETYSAKAQENLKELVLIPSILEEDPSEDTIAESKDNDYDNNKHPRIHSGTFPKGTFIISNHADELTPWTPILANLSQSPFMMIPCCSHNLTGSKFRAPGTKTPKTSNSAYASLVSWVTTLATDCGWKIEKEMLRIPSTRNTALLGRRRNVDYDNIDIAEIVEKYGGAAGWRDNAMKLVKGGLRGH